VLSKPVASCRIITVPGQRENAWLHLPRTSRVHWEWSLYTTITLHTWISWASLSCRQACPLLVQARDVRTITTPTLTKSKSIHERSQPRTTPGYLPSYYIHTHVVLSPPTPLASRQALPSPTPTTPTLKLNLKPVGSWHEKGM
jgi:hypothetical protein